MFTQVYLHKQLSCVILLVLFYWWNWQDVEPNELFIVRLLWQSFPPVPSLISSLAMTTNRRSVEFDSTAESHVLFFLSKEGLMRVWAFSELSCFTLVAHIILYYCIVISIHFSCLALAKVMVSTKVSSWVMWSLKHFLGLPRGFLPIDRTLLSSWFTSPAPLDMKEQQLNTYFLSNHESPFVPLTDWPAILQGFQLLKGWNNEQSTFLHVDEFRIKLKKG